MALVKLDRCEADQAAIQLRLLARKIESGDVSYCVVYAMNESGSIDELVYDALTASPSFRAKA